MILNWTFENGQLTVHNETGRRLFSWLTNESMVRALTELLNHYQPFSQQILSRIFHEV
jgi:hypothetical protein